MGLKERLAYAQQKYVDIRLAEYFKDAEHSKDLSEDEKVLAKGFATQHYLIGDFDQDPVQERCSITGKETKCVALMTVPKYIIKAVDFVNDLNKDETQRRIFREQSQQQSNLDKEIAPYLGLSVRHLPKVEYEPLTPVESSKLRSLYKENLIFDCKNPSYVTTLRLLKQYEQGVAAQFEKFLDNHAEILGLKEEDYPAKMECVPNFTRNGVLIYDSLELPFCKEEGFRNPVISCTARGTQPSILRINLGVLSQEDKKIFEAIDLNQISSRFFKNHKDNDLLAGKDFNENETLSAFKQELNKILKQIADQEVVTIELRNERSLTQLFVHEMEHNILERFIEKEAKVLEEHTKPLNPDDFTLSYREKLDHTNVYNINPNFLTYIEYGETDVLTPEEIEKIENFLKKHEIVGGPATEALESPSFGRDAITGVKGDIVPVTCINLEAVKDEENRRLADARIASLSEENQKVFEDIFSNHIKSPEFQNNRTLIEPFREKLAEMFEEAQVKGQTLKINVNTEKQKQQEQPKQESKKKDLER